MNDTVWPCPVKIDCECADSQIIRNYSSEAPDPFTYFSLRYYQSQPRLNAPPNNYITPRSPGICYSPVSPQAAGDCALHNAQNRTWAPWNPNPTQYGNQAQTCEVACPSGPAFSYTVPANTFFSNFSQAKANALARSYCFNRGFVERECPPIAITLDSPFIGTMSAVLLGSVDPNGDDTIAYFEWGTTTAYGNTTDTQQILADDGAQQINALINGLTPGVTYHYRIVAFSTMGVSEGGDKTVSIPSVCGAVAASIADCVWADKEVAFPFCGTGGAPCCSSDPGPNCGNCVDLLTGGDGSFEITSVGSSTASSKVTTICNPGADYVLTIKVLNPWTTCTISGAPPHAFLFQVILNGVLVDQVVRDAFIGPFTTMTMSCTLPGGQTSTLELRASYLALGAPASTYYGTIEIRPLTPP